MAHFYSRIQGNRGGATRCGSKASGVSATAESWSTVANVRQFASNGSDHVRFTLTTKHGNYLLEGAFDAERVARFAGSDGNVDAALAWVEQSLAALDEAARQAQKDADAVEAEELANA